MRGAVPPCSLMRPFNVACAGALEPYRLARAVGALARGGESVLFQWDRTVLRQEVRRAFRLQPGPESEKASLVLGAQG